jgi:hypothetical protein
MRLCNGSVRNRVGRARRRLTMEGLEERRLLATLLVPLVTLPDAPTSDHLLVRFVPGDFHDLQVGDDSGGPVQNVSLPGAGTSAAQNGFLLTGPTGGRSAHVVAVLAEDWNGDGIPDLAIEFPTSIRVVYGQADGTFQFAFQQTFGAGSGNALVAFGPPGAFGHPSVLSVRVTSPTGTLVTLVADAGSGPTPDPVSGQPGPGPIVVSGPTLTPAVLQAASTSTDHPDLSGPLPAVTTPDRSDSSTDNQVAAAPSGAEPSAPAQRDPGVAARAPVSHAGPASHPDSTDADTLASTPSSLTPNVRAGPANVVSSPIFALAPSLEADARTSPVPAVERFTSNPLTLVLSTELAPTLQRFAASTSDAPAGEWGPIVSPSGVDMASERRLLLLSPPPALLMDRSGRSYRDELVGDAVWLEPGPPLAPTPEPSATAESRAAGTILGTATPEQHPVLTDLGQALAQALYLGNLRPNDADARAESGPEAVAAPGDPRLVVADLIQRSTEAFTRLVQGFYLFFLGRAALAGEENGWVAMLLRGQTEEQVLAAFLSTAEFGERANRLSRTGTSDERFLQALYRLLFGRMPAEAERSNWLSALPRLGRGGVASLLLASTEYRTLQIETYYLDLLRRPGGPAEVAAWAESPFDLLTLRLFFEARPEWLAGGGTSSDGSAVVSA